MEPQKYLASLLNYPTYFGVTPKAPHRLEPMSHYQRQAIQIFEREMQREIRNGKDPRKGEFILFFRLRENKSTSKMEVRANGPIIYCEGRSSEAPMSRQTIEGTFLCIHSHPSGHRPSPTDFLVAREYRDWGMVKYEMVRTPDGKYLVYNGSVPPRYSCLVDIGPNHQTPPASPDWPLRPVFNFQ